MSNGKYKCAYCPYMSYRHSYIVEHVKMRHLGRVVCYGCMLRSFAHIHDLRAHLQRLHPNDVRAWGTLEHYSKQLCRTFLYFGRDDMGHPRQYTFVADDVINDSI